MAEIKIYTSNTCVFCKAAKQYFNENNIEFKEMNIDENPDAVEYLVSKGYRGVPVINIDGEDIVGFDKAAIEKKLGL
ncbi:MULTISPECIES: glutaredoxin family protein [unclassified Anaerococcus]|uniref:glutaredoxin family protein n=1 Tax=unclassified Anaerococcus TaxID=2614126 RepID=UPI000C07F415|nr:MULTISPECIES: glutaredoxin family protein [unclassified Anaerococcus]